MVQENVENRALVSFVATVPSSEPMRPAQLGIAWNAALQDFVRGKTTVSAIREVSRILNGALAAHKQASIEDGQLTASRIRSYF